MLVAALVAAATSVSAAAQGADGVAPAATAPLAYTCQVLGQTRTFTVVGDTDAPRRLAFGETVAATVSFAVTLPEDVTATIRDDLRAAAVDGPATVAGRIGKADGGWDLGFVRASVPATGPMTLVTSLPVGTFSGNKMGRSWRIRTGDLNATLLFYRADGQPTSPIPSAAVSCAMPTDQRSLIRKVTVVKDTTTTTVVGKDTAVGSRGRAKIKVASTHGRTPKGEVRVKLFHRGDLVSERVLDLEKGKAKLRTRRLEERGWSVTAKYAGSDTFRGSHGSDKIKVR